MTLLADALDIHNLPDNAVICLIAPTASGKTALACELYDRGNFELISVDSALIYRGMDIGTAKPTNTELARYPHHLVDVLAPSTCYSVARFVADVTQLIEAVHQRGKTPVLVGGTMLYFMALLDGISAVPQTLPKTRALVLDMLKEEGIEALHTRLSGLDQITAKRLHPTDTQRICRALEVALQTKIPMSHFQRLPKCALARQKHHWRVNTFCLPRKTTHARIKARLRQMWEAGLVEEVKALLRCHPMHPDMPAMRAVGYRQVLEYLVFCGDQCIDTPHYHAVLDGLTLPNDYKQARLTPCQIMQNRALYATRQLAKHQETWIGRLHRLEIFDQLSSVRLHHIKV